MGLLLLGSTLWLLAIGVPLVAAALQSVAGANPTPGVSATLDGAATSRGTHTIHEVGALIAAGWAWSLGVGAAAAAVGWLPGRRLRAARPGARRALFAAALVAPLALPAYLLPWCWWQALPPGSALGDWAIRNDATMLLRGVALALGLLAWGWPIAAWSVAAIGRGGRAGRDPAQDAMLLDGAGAIAWLRLAWHQDRAALLLGAGIVALFVFGNTTAFDLAQIRSFGFELRTLDSRGATSAELLRAALPAVIVAALGAATLWIAAGRGVREPGAASGPPQGVKTGIGIGPWLLVLVTIGVPLLLMLARLPVGRGVSEFFRLHRDALVGTFGVATAVGTLAAVVAASATLRHIGSTRARTFATLEGAGWAFGAFVPATAVVASVIAAYNGALLGPVIYDRPIAAVLAQLAIFGVIAALLGRFAAATVGAEQRAAMALDGATRADGRLRAASPAVAAAAISSFGVVAALCLGEVVVAPRLMPPGVPVLATSILNAVHYQDPETVMLATIGQVVVALVVALVAVWMWRPDRPLAWPLRGASRVVLLALALGSSTLVLPSCRSRDGGDDAGWPPLPVLQSFGNRGDSPGTFDYPRAVALDDERGRIYVVDKTARVQRFDRDGRFELEWAMPESALGRPTGITVAKDGTVWVADTHYHRVIAFDPDGRELLRFGSYGSAPGEFIYPTDVAIAPDGELYVAEYGGNERVQVFSPTGEFRFAFGSFGSGVGEFMRPQAMAFAPSGEELYIADSCNHRIVVTDRRGAWLRTFGTPGSAAGEFAYPYGLDVAHDGSLMVVEFGSSRLQQLSPDGESLRLWGGAGDELGRLRAPWGVACGASTIVVLDSGNARVLLLPSSP